MRDIIETRHTHTHTQNKFRLVDQCILEVVQELKNKLMLFSIDIKNKNHAIKIFIDKIWVEASLVLIILFSFDN